MPTMGAAAEDEAPGRSAAVADVLRESGVGIVASSQAVPAARIGRTARRTAAPRGKSVLAGRRGLAVPLRAFRTF